MVILDLVERLLSALSFFYLGVMKALHYPLTKHRLSLALSGPPFLVSLMFVILAVEEAAGVRDIYVTHLLRFWLICLALMFGFTEHVRLSRRMRLRDYVDEHYSDLLDLDAVGLDRLGVISLLETIGFEPGKINAGKIAKTDPGDGDDDLESVGQESPSDRRE